ncbi:MAG: ABC transporter ATP-binding protein [Hyphomicrobiaceae bacterium]
MLRVSNLHVSIGPIPIIRGASFDVTEGQMCGVIGRNGAGKTTIMRALMGALPATGKAELEHIDLLTLPAHRRVIHGVGYMPEDRRLVPEFTVEENIRVPSWSTSMDGVEQRLEWIFSIMPEVAKFRDRRALELSGGQQKMVALARALVAGRRLLLLDEPFEGLAPALARRLGEVLANLKSEGVSVLISESNEVHVADLLSRAYRIERGVVSII